MRFSLWTDDPGLAAVADAAGVERIGPDLERFGKAERQHGPDNLISGHDERSIPAIRAAIGPGRLFIRCDPAHEGLGAALDRLLDAGVTTVMLPMVHTAAEVARVARRIGGRATLIPIVEQADALAAVDEIAAVEGVGELYLGVNDLSRSLGLGSRFGALTRSVVGRVAEAAARRGRGLGFFGVGRVHSPALPVEPDLALATFVHYGVGTCLLARSFVLDVDGFAARLDAVRARLDHWAAASTSERGQAVDAFFAACARAEAAVRAAPGTQTPASQWRRALPGRPSMAGRGDESP